MGIENKIVVITGAAGSLGRVVTRQFAEQGARLALLGSNAEHLQSLANELHLPAERVLTHAADLRNAAAAQTAARAVVEKFGRMEILLHLVGGWTDGQALEQVDAEHVTEMLQQHLWTTFHLAQAFVPHLVVNHWGRVVIVSSPYAAHPSANGGPYAIAKAAQEALMLTLAQEVKDSGVTANVLLVRTIDAGHERDRARTAKNATWTTPEEIAATMRYLCSDEGQVINGARIPLYGST